MNGNIEHERRKKLNKDIRERFRLDRRTTEQRVTGTTEDRLERPYQVVTHNEDGTTTFKGYGKSGFTYEFTTEVVKGDIPHNW